eukprot:9485508-Pyramimonas_sp.AAC.1
MEKVCFAGHPSRRNAPAPGFASSLGTPRWAPLAPENYGACAWLLAALSPRRPRPFPPPHPPPPPPRPP